MVFSLFFTLPSYRTEECNDEGRFGGFGVFAEMHGLLVDLVLSPINLIYRRVAFRVFALYQSSIMTGGKPIKNIV